MLEQLLDCLNVQVWTADDAGALTFVNEYTAAYFGIPRDRLIGEGWQNVLHSADLSIAVERWTHAVRTGAPYDVDFRLLRAADRKYRWHHASARFVAIDGDRRAWVGTNVDIDAEKRADEVLQAWKQQLKS